MAEQINLPLSAFDLQFTEFRMDDEALPVGHTLGNVVPIFRRIEAAEVCSLVIFGYVCHKDQGVRTFGERHQNHEGFLEALKSNS